MYFCSFKTSCTGEWGVASLSVNAGDGVIITVVIAFTYNSHFLPVQPQPDHQQAKRSPTKSARKPEMQPLM